MTTFTTSQPLSPSGVADVPAERRMLAGGVVLGLLHVGFVAFMAFFLGTSHPPVDVPAADAAADFHDVAGLVGVGTWLLLLTIPPALLFLGGLTSVLRRHAGDAAASTALLAGGLTLVLVAAGALVSLLSASVGGDDTSPAAGAVVKALDSATPLSLAISGFPRAVLIVVAAAALARTGLAGRGLLATSYLLAGLGLIGTGTVFTAALFPLAVLPALLFAAWCASVAVILRRRLAEPLR